MFIATPDDARAFVAAWARGASPERATWHIRDALASRQRIISILRSNARDVSDHIAIASVLRAAIGDAS
jgi:hypothetical protein